MNSRADVALLESLDRQYRRVFTDENVEWIDHLTIAAATIGFVVHLSLIGLANLLESPPHWSTATDSSWCFETPGLSSRRY